ncbi:MAG: ATP-binding protein [Frankiaceae bacterium]
MTAPADEVRADEVRDFARSFRGFLRWIRETDTGDSHSNEVVRLVRSHLGADGLAQSVVSRELPPFEQVNVQVALDTWSAQPGREVTTQGLALPPHYGGLTLQQLVHGDALPPVRLSAPDLVDLPAGPDRNVACLRRALLLVADPRGTYVLLVRGPDRHEEPILSLEIAGLSTDAAQDVLRELADLQSALNVYRGQTLELIPGPAGPTIAFPVLPATARVDVVLPEPVLRRIERHTLDMAAHRDALRSAGQHLKRGLLLYGPPGTGKTHTTRYVVQHLDGATVLMLSGQSLQMIGMVTQLARDLQPAVIVLEDVDLVAEDRGFGPSSSPILFELLDATDGAAADADLLFLLTTNRADLLEPALAARPGRVDVAVEIGLPDAGARRRLLEVYSRHVPLSASAEERESVVIRSEGVTASFVKELLRRAVLEALPERGGELESVTGEHLIRALDDLLDSTQSVTRALLGVPNDQSGPQRMPLIGRA